MTEQTQRLTLEPLEDRMLLSTCVVNTLADTGAGLGGAGDLRYCINRTNATVAPDIVGFSVNGTIQLTKALPKLTSNIDIQGPGSGLLTVRRNTGEEYRIFTVTRFQRDYFGPNDCQQQSTSGDFGRGDFERRELGVK